MILRVATFRVPADAAPAMAEKAQALFSRVQRTDGLAWSAVGRQPDGAAIAIVSVSVWRDRAALERALGTELDGRSQAEARAGLPPSVGLEYSDVVDGVGLPPGLAPAQVFTSRRRRALVPQDCALLRQLCAGATLAEAAASLGVSVGTAKNRRHEIYEKLGVHDLGAACAVAGPDLGLDQKAS